MSRLIVRALAITALMLAVTVFVSAQTADQSQSSTGATSSAKGKKSNKGGAAGEGQSSGSMDKPDQNFMDKAAQGGLAEVQLGQLAAQNAASPEVKQFGQRMVDDHSKANDQLKQLASQKGVTLPTTLNPKDEAEKDRLSKLQGEQFDRAYMNAMVKDHTKDVSEFRKESQSAKDPDVKSFASQTLPTLEDHLKLAKSIAPKERAEATSGKKGKGTGGANTSASQTPPQ